MKVVLSVSAHEVIERGTVRFKGNMTEQDWYALAMYMYGPSLPHGDTLKAFDTPKGPVRIERTGTDKAIWLYGDKRIDTLDQFDRLLRPLPMKSATYCGDFYMAVRGRNHFQYLIRPFGTKDLLWFDDKENLTDYYADRSIKPAYQIMDKRSPSTSIMRSWSNDMGDVFVVDHNTNEVTLLTELSA